MKRAACFASLAACTSPGAAEQLQFRQNGLEVHATYARGVDAPELIARHLATPRRAPDGRPAAWISHEDWRVPATMDGDTSRVLQVRGEGNELEAISAELDARQSPPA